MKKLISFLLALCLVSGQAFAYTITRTLEERVTDANTGDSYRRVTGSLALDSSHPAEGETLLPTQLGMASFTKITIDSATPPFGSWTTTQVPRRFGFDYTNSRFFVLSIRQADTTFGTAGNPSFSVEVSGPVTYNLAYLTRVPFEAVGPIV